MCAEDAVVSMFSESMMMASNVIGLTLMALP